MDEELILIKRLDHLREKHRQIDEQTKDINLDPFSQMRLKKEKLALRDEIARIERIVYPDIIA
jgi:hypothetical protein